MYHITVSAQFHKGVNKFNFDTSFETNSALWLAKIDTNDAFHGQRCLLLKLGMTDWLGGVMFKRLPSNTPFTFSFYARGPGNLKISLSCQDNWSLVAAKKFKLDNKWKRYLINLPVQKRTYAMRVDFKKNINSSIRLDAFQLNKGASALAYSPAKALVVGFDSLSGAGNIQFISKNALNMKLNIHNNLDQQQNVLVKWETESYNGNIPVKGKIKLKIPAQKTSNSLLKVLPQKKRGYYVVRVRVFKNGKEIAITNFPLTVVDEPSGSSKNSSFGLFPCGQQPYQSLRNIGVSWFRTVSRWRHAPKNSNGEYILAPPVKDDFFWMKTLNILAAPPQYAMTSGKIDISEAEKYVLSTVKASKKYNHFWEFQNEPDLSSCLKESDQSTKATYYAEIINKIAPKIKEIDPNAVILAGGTSGVDFDFNCIFLRKTLEIAGKNIDIIPVHPYSHARFISSANSDRGPGESGMGGKYKLIKNIIKQYGGEQNIWAGEIGWALDVRADYLSPAARRHAAYLLCTMLISRAHNVKKIMYFLSELCLEREYFYYGLWRNKAPMPATATYATATQLLENIKSGKEYVNGNLHIVVYQYKNGKALGAIWLESKRNKIKMKLPFTPKDVEVRDMYNNSLQLPPREKIKLEISGEPVFILGKNLSYKKLTTGLRTADRTQFPIIVNWQIAGNNAVNVIMKNISNKNIKVSGGIGGFGIHVKPKLRRVNFPPKSKKIIKFLASENINGRRLILKLLVNKQYMVNTFTPQLEACLKRGTLKSYSVNLKERKYLLPVDPGISWDGPEDLSINAKLSWGDKGLYFDAVVRDDIHHVNKNKDTLWNGDAIQLAICPENSNSLSSNGYNVKDLEINFALSPKGENIQFGYYGNRNLKKIKALCQAKISRLGNLTTYNCLIPWSVIGIQNPIGEILKINFTVNDCDLPMSLPSVREYWLGLTLGIGECKNPNLFRKFIITK